MAPQTPFEARILARASLTGAACTLLVVNTAAAAAGTARNNQGKVVLFLFANASVVRWHI